MFDSKHKLQTTFGEGEMKDPNAASRSTSRTAFSMWPTQGWIRVLVYDADSYKLLRKIGTTGKNHTLTDPGNFSKPTNVAVDKDGNLYVADTLNDRVEVFDADGNFIRTLGKNGDGPGDFARPKGIAVDPRRTRLGCRCHAEPASGVYAGGAIADGRGWIRHHARPV